MQLSTLILAIGSVSALSFVVPQQGVKFSTKGESAIAWESTAGDPSSVYFLLKCVTCDVELMGAKQLLGKFDTKVGYAFFDDSKYAAGAGMYVVEAWATEPNVLPAPASPNGPKPLATSVEFEVVKAK